MDVDVIEGIAISAVAFSVVTFLLLRFTSLPGLRPWAFAAIVVLSYPVAFGFAFLADFMGLQSYTGNARAVRICFLVATITVVPTSVWAGVRLCFAIRRRPQRVLWVAGPCFAVLLIFGLVRHSIVPLQMIDYQAWRDAHPNWSHGASDDPDANSSWVKAQAQIDYAFSPNVSRGRITFVDFWRESPDCVYLRFIVDIHTGVIYRYAPREKRLVWKAWWPISDS
jgi:hypothetical protein